MKKHWNHQKKKRWNNLNIQSEFTGHSWVKTGFERQTPQVECQMSRARYLTVSLRVHTAAAGCIMCIHMVTYNTLQHSRSSHIDGQLVHSDLPIYMYFVPTGEDRSTSTLVKANSAMSAECVRRRLGWKKWPSQSKPASPLYPWWQVSISFLIQSTSKLLEHRECFFYQIATLPSSVTVRGKKGIIHVFTNFDTTFLRPINKYGAGFWWIYSSNKTH